MVVMALYRVVVVVFEYKVVGVFDKVAIRLAVVVVHSLVVDSLVVDKFDMVVVVADSLLVDKFDMVVVVVDSLLVDMAVVCGELNDTVCLVN